MEAAARPRAVGSASGSGAARTGVEVEGGLLEGDCSALETGVEDVVEEGLVVGVVLEQGGLVGGRPA